MQTTLVRQAVVALALGATAAAASALPAFTFNPGAFSSNATSFTADKIAISDYATVTLNPGNSTFSESGLLSISSFQYLGKDLAVAGLNSNYGLYIAFTATGNVTAANPTTTATSGSFTSLSYQLYGYNGTATFGVTAGSAPTVTFSNTGTTGTLLGTGSLGAGGNFLSTAPTGTSLFANAGATLNFTPVLQSFFTSPTPFYNMAFSSFTNTPDTVTAFNGGFSIANGGGTISFITAVPEPETYALMLAGLGVMGFVARRRQAK